MSRPALGCPNDEARPGTPQDRDTLDGIYEGRDPTSNKDAVRGHRHRSAGTPDPYVAARFLFAPHDDTFECRAYGLPLDAVDEPYPVAVEQTRWRARACTGDRDRLTTS